MLARTQKKMDNLYFFGTATQFIRGLSHTQVHQRRLHWLGGGKKERGRL